MKKIIPKMAVLSKMVVNGLMSALIITPMLAHGESVEELSIKTDWKGSKISVKAELRFPDNTTDNRIPLLIIQHSSGPDVRLKLINGYTDSIGFLVGDLGIKNGFAVLYTDVFTPRNIKKDASGDLGVGTSVARKDLRKIIALIKRDNRIDPNRIYLFGHSYGGGVAMRLAQDENHGGLKIRAIVASAPGCQEQIRKIVVPTLLIIGEKDDWTSPRACKKIAEKSLQQNNYLKFIVVKEANHSYSKGGTWAWNRQNRTGCIDSVVERNKDGTWSVDGVTVSREQVKEKCIKQGATAGGNGELLSELTGNAISFFNENR